MPKLVDIRTSEQRPNRQSVREAWKGLQKPEEGLQISESKNPVPDSKTVAMTGLGDAFVKRGSPVQVRSSAYVFNPVTATI